MLMSILYGSLDEHELQEKHIAYASKMKLREKGQIIPKRTLRESNPPAETSEARSVLPVLTEKEIDEMYYLLIKSLLLPERINKLASEVLELIKNQDSPDFVLHKAKIEFSQFKYKEVLETIEDYLDENKFDVEAIVLQANSLYKLDKYDESEKAFLRAIRRGADDPVLKKKLGLIYIKNKKWREALTVFEEYCNKIDSK